MAATKQVFSVSHVIDEVCSDIVENDGEKREIPTLHDTIKASVDEFYCLRNSVDDLTKFKLEASDSLEQIYRRHAFVKCHYGCWNEFGYGFH